MKKKIISMLLIGSLSAFAISMFPANSPSQDKSHAQVNRILGKYVFVLSQPVLDYDVVDDLSTQLGSALLGKKSIDDQITEMIKRGMKRQEKGKIGDFDAIITKDGKEATLIKFRD